MLTVQEAAESAGIIKDTVYKALRLGRLPSVEMYGRLLIRQEDWEAYRQSATRGRPPKRGKKD